MSEPRPDHATCRVAPEHEEMARDVHLGVAARRLAMRADVLAAAYVAHPERFPAGRPAPAAAPTEVWINPSRNATSR